MGSFCSNLSLSNKKSEVSNIEGSRWANVSYPNLFFFSLSSKFSLYSEEVREKKQSLAFFLHLSFGPASQGQETSKAGQKKKIEKDDFFFLFSGFTDTEGNFLITIDRSFVKFRFKISLHIYDIEALNIIKSKLNIGRVTVEINRDRCSFIVKKYDEIRNVICPLFKSYSLHRSKRLDFEYFNKAVLPPPFF